MEKFELSTIQVTNAFRQFGFPRPHFGHGSAGLPVTNAFRQFGFPRRQFHPEVKIVVYTVTNAFRQFGFPRLFGGGYTINPRGFSHQCLSAIRVSPSQWDQGKTVSRHKSHQCLSAIRVSPSGTSTSGDKGTSTSPMPFGNSGFPVYWFREIGCNWKDASPMPFGNSGFPVQNNMSKVTVKTKESPMPFGNSGFPVLNQTE